MNTKIYSKPTHTGRYLHFHSNHSSHVKRRVVQNLYHSATVIYQEQQVRFDDIFTSKLDLQPIALGFCYQETQEKCFSEEGGAATLFYVS
jgi:hypothetical protein